MENPTTYAEVVAMAQTEVLAIETTTTYCSMDDLHEFLSKNHAVAHVALQDILSSKQH